MVRRTGLLELNSWYTRGGAVYLAIVMVYITSFTVTRFLE